jgi:hypothetical protein
MDALNKKSIWFEGIRDKNHQRTPRGMMARSVLLNFYTELKHALALNAIEMLAIILTAAPLLLTILLSA